MDYIALITYLFVMTGTPGPNNIMLTVSGTNFGYRKTIPHMLGICAGNSTQAALCCLGLGTVFTAYPILHHILTWVGLAYMLYLSWKLLSAKLKDSKQVTRPINFKQAFLFQYVNPKAWVICITLATIFMPKTGEVFIPTLIIALCVAVTNLPCTTMWTLFGKGMKKLLKTEKNQLLFNYIMAGLLVVTAVMIVLK